MTVQERIVTVGEHVDERVADANNIQSGNIQSGNIQSGNIQSCCTTGGGVRHGGRT